jgi:hypothetical protein
MAGWARLTNHGHVLLLFSSPAPARGAARQRLHPRRRYHPGDLGRSGLNPIPTRGRSSEADRTVSRKVPRMCNQQQGRRPRIVLQPSPGHFRNVISRLIPQPRLNGRPRYEPKMFPMTGRWSQRTTRTFPLPIHAVSPVLQPRRVRRAGTADGAFACAPRRV